MTQVAECASQLTKKAVVKLLIMWPLHRDACNMVADFREREGEKRRRKRRRGRERRRKGEGRREPVEASLV